MSIEKSLERIADGIEVIIQRLNENSGEDTPQPASEKRTTKKKASKKTNEPVGDNPPPGGATEDELRLVFQEYVGKKGSEEGTAKLKELIEGFGASKIGEVKPENYAEIIEEVKSWK